MTSQILSFKKIKIQGSNKKLIWNNLPLWLYIKINSFLNTFKNWKGSKIITAGIFFANADITDLFIYLFLELH